MGKIEAKAHVAARNNIGQFIRECEVAATGTVQQMVEEGADMSRKLAPVGVKHDRRTVPLKDSISTEMFGRTNGRWVSRARHTLAIEKGAAPHPIVGSPFLKFFWEAAGRMWVPGLYGTPDIVNHPGNAAQPFMEPALVMVSARFPQIAKRFYPG